MSILTRPLTYDDLIQMPDDNKRYEIIGGEIVVTAAPTPEHQRFSRRLLTWISDFSEPRGLGEAFAAPLDVVLGEHEIVQPDLIFVTASRRHIVGAKMITGAPDLVIEILSASTRIRDESLKAELYAAAGIPEYWIVDPIHRSVRVYNLRAGRYELDPRNHEFAHSTILPGFTVSTVNLFADFS